MAKKRKQADSNTDDPLYNKHARLSQFDCAPEEGPSAPQSRIDPTYGQRGAFPGLDDSVGEDELFYGPANDGLEYLRMVRSEAKNVPNLLVAPTPSFDQLNDDGLYDEYPQGYYADGAYTAVPLPSSTTAPREAIEDDEDLDPQESYYKALCVRFTDLSSLLQTTPHLPDGIPTPPATYKSRQWRYEILKSTPKPASLAQIPQHAVILGLEVLEDVLTNGNLRTAQGKNIGAWAWGLLARCRELGMMGSEEVGVLRKLGKKAVWLLRRIAAGEVVEGEVVGGEEEAKGGAQEEEDGDDAGLGNADADDDDDGNEMDAEDQTNIDPITMSNDEVEPLPSPPREEQIHEDTLTEAKQRILSSLPPVDEIQPDADTPLTTTINPGTAAPQNDSSKLHERPDQKVNNNNQEDTNNIPMDKEAVHATLDMIVTIVGEFYGQRDLLDRRLLWDEMA